MQGGDPTMSLVNLVVRPQRAEYTMDDMPEGDFNGINDSKVIRDDMQLISRGKKMECSFYHFEKSETDYPCVIYLHGNAGCRIEGAQYAPWFAKAGIQTFAFDYVGCGLSEGDYISLGHYEQEDLGEIIRHLSEDRKIEKIGLFGRSMGGSTALLYASKHHSTIKSMVIDSSFSEFQPVFHGLASGFGIPQFMAIGIYTFVQTKIKELLAFDIDELKPVEAAKLCLVPCLFLHAEHDTLIEKQHSVDNHAAYAGPKELVNFPGDHNSMRPNYINQKVIKHFLSSFIC